MKKIVIIAAMDEELEAIQNKFENIEEKKLKDLVYYEGQANGKEYVLTKCGVGKVNSARVTQMLIDNFDIEYIMNVGIAGSLNDELEIGDIVIGKKLVQHDFDITAFDHEKGYIPNVGVYIESDSYLVNLAKSSEVKNIKVGNIASGDIFCTLESMSNKINFKFNALAVEMEGASVAQVCHLCKVPFLVIRSISDIPGNNNVVSYEEFLIESSKKVAKLMNDILIKIC